MPQETQVVDPGPNGLSLDTLKFMGRAFVVGYAAYLLGYFGFSPSWLVLGSCAYAVRCHLRQQMKAKASLRSLVLDKKNITTLLEDLPSWVYFPDTERCEWVNKMMTQLWPFIGQYVQELIIETIEPSIRSSLPAYLQSFKFETIDLGDVAPRIGGIKVYCENVGRNEIIMDMDLIYSGDCNLVIKIKGFKAGIKEVQLRGLLRVELRPLTKQIPLIGGATACFLRPPLVDFTLTNIGEIMEIPGVNDLLKKAVADQISAMMVLPNKYSHKLIESVSSHMLKYSLPRGVLRIQVIEAAKLVKADIGMLGMGKSDPYAVLMVGSSEFRTQVIPSTITPRWDYACEAVVHQLPGSVLDIEVYDEDQSSKDDFLGRCALKIQDLADKGICDMWMKLEAVKSGQIHIRTEWVTLSNNPADLEQALEHKKSLTTNHQHSTGLLSVFLDCASGLPNSMAPDPNDSMLEGDSLPYWKHSFLRHFALLAEDLYEAVAPAVELGSKGMEPSCQVVLSMDKEDKKSSVMLNTVNPVWEETFTFLCANPDIQELHAKVVDTKTNQVIGSASISTARLLKEDDMTLDEPIVLKGTNSAKLMLTLQLRILKSSSPGVPLRSTTPAYSRSSSERESTPDRRSQSSADGNLNQATPLSPTKPEIPSVDEMVQSTITPILETLHGTTKTNALAPGLGGLTKSSSWNSQMRVTLRYSPPRNRLICVIHQVKDLPPSLNDEDEIYIKAQLSPCDTNKHKENKHKTRSLKVSSNLEFDETIELDVVPHELSLCSLQLQLRAKPATSNMFNRSRKMVGQLILSLDMLDGVSAITEWYFLSPAT